MDPLIPSKSPLVNPESDVPLDDLMSIAEEENLAAKLSKEFNKYSIRRLPEENNALRWFRANNGVYDPGVSFETHQSDVYIKLLSKEVRKAMGKILKLTRPITGEPWSIDLSPRPYAPLVADADPQELTKRAQEMYNTIREDMRSNGFNPKYLRAIFEYVVLGTMFWLGPVGAEVKDTHWVMSANGQYEQMEENKDYVAGEYEWLPWFQVYCDPDATEIEDCMSVFIRRTPNRSQLRRLKKNPLFDAKAIDEVLKEHTNGNWKPEQWESQLQALANTNQYTKDNRFILLQRWGVLSGSDLKEIGKDIPDENLEQEFMTNVWLCGGKIIRADISKFHSDRIPIIAARYERMAGKIHGRGAPEQGYDSERVCNSAARAIVDNFAMSSGPQIVVDTSQIVAGTDVMTQAPRKIWPIRYNENSSKNKPVDFFVPPTMIDELTKVFVLFKGLLSEQTMLPDMENLAQEAGSGVRTIGQTSMVFEKSEGWIKMVIGNLDEEFWTPIISGYYRWNMTYNPNNAIKGDFRVVAKGVEGAMAREALLQKLIELQTFLNNPQLAKKVNLQQYAKVFWEAMDLVDRGIIYTDEQVEANDMKEKQMEAEQAAKGQIQLAQGQERVRAESSRSDALLSLAKMVPPTSPAWAPAIEQAYEAYHAATPQLYAGLNIHLKLIEMQALSAGAVGPDAEAALKTPLGPEAPEDLDVDQRQEFQQLADAGSNAANSMDQPTGMEGAGSVPPVQDGGMSEGTPEPGIPGSENG